MNGFPERVTQDRVVDLFRDRLREAVPPVLGVTVAGFFIQRMKTKWGSCNPRARTIRLNTDLARKPQERLEYLVVHELVHLIEPTHNAHFVDLMDRFLPNWGALPRSAQPIARPPRNLGILNGNKVSEASREFRFGPLSSRQ